MNITHCGGEPKLKLLLVGTQLLDDSMPPWSSARRECQLVPVWPSGFFRQTLPLAWFTQSADLSTDILPRVPFPLWHQPMLLCGEVAPSAALQLLSNMAVGKARAQWSHVGWCGLAENYFCLCYKHPLVMEADCLQIHNFNSSWTCSQEIILPFSVKWKAYN